MADLLLPDLAATEALGGRLAALLRPGDVVLLEGPLGAGKSALARAMLRTLLDDPALDVPSPTYTLVQTYDSKLGAVAHYDLWRLDGAPALRELGWDAVGSDGASVALVEWPDRLGVLRPEDALTVTLTLDGEGRRAVLTGWEGRL